MRPLLRHGRAAAASVPGVSALRQDRISNFAIGIHVHLLQSAPSSRYKDDLLVGLPVSNDDDLDATA
jgi:hypothetical protein